MTETIGYPIVTSVEIFKKKYYPPNSSAYVWHWYIRYTGLENGSANAREWFFEDCSCENPPSLEFVAWSANKMKERTYKLIHQNSEG